VDATQGIQAQTLSVLRAAKHHTKIPVLNKIDLDLARPRECAAELEALLGAGGGEGGPIVPVSAKSGLNVEKLLQRIVDKIPPPDGNSAKPLRALVFDNHFDDYRGVVSLVAIKDGCIRKGDKVKFAKAGKVFDVTDVGILHPDAISCPEGLFAGQCGWLTCGMKDEMDAHLGDTLHDPRVKTALLAEFKPMQAMVFAGFFPQDTSDFAQLEEAVKRLTLTDRAITSARESSAALGQGFRLGFLGSLHLDVVRQRLEDEYQAEVIITRPFVPLKSKPSALGQHF
jgi:elongation factor 4